MTNKVIHTTAGLLILLAVAFIFYGCSASQPENQPIIVLKGQEDTSARMHILALNVDPPENGEVQAGIQARIDQIQNAGGMAVITTSELTGAEYVEELGSLEGYTGLELFNMGNNYIWDSILTDRIAHDEPLVWGFAGDDLHYPFQLGFGFVMVRSPKVSEQDILDSLKSGSFYWGNTSVIKNISLDRNKIRIELFTEANISFIKAGGEAAAQVLAKAASYQIRGDEGYVRVEVQTPSGKMAGTQPFRVKNTETVSNPYLQKGYWLKGNLHTHTTNSDGELSPEEAINLYDEKGYDFLAITDHVAWVIPEGTGTN